ncbi:response regulator [Anaerostipes hadrus]|uniref:Stage 0 sporulation protein A homolog n=1 Tax=Anaerostipes amylophilus TaxID=2981779 RepID=A0ABV1IXV9_9FIRM|nr:response regulator [Anaerostipes amylophilus]MCO7163023.1 response regulator [Anaerostipes hadrus]CUO27705.1 Signal transduction histidine-protein kinase BarA [Anaerostipes hadrus]
MSILNKTLKTMQTSKLSDAVSAYEESQKKVTLSDFIKDNLAAVSVGCTGAFLLVLIVFLKLLQKARIESGKMELDENYASVRTVVKEIYDVFEPEATKKEVDYIQKVDVIYEHILCDITKVEQILLNLVSNAVKYTASGGTVKLKIQEIPCDQDGLVQIKTEDNELNAEIAITILNEMGMKVDHVEDGVQCVSKIEQMPADIYDLILMDIQMPNMDGYRATEAIRDLTDQKKAKILIIAMTANAFEEDRKMALSKCMNGHIAKLIDVKNMEEVLMSVLR